MRRDAAASTAACTAQPAPRRGGNRGSGNGRDSGRISTNASATRRGSRWARPNTFMPGESTIHVSLAQRGQRIQRGRRRRVAAGAQRLGHVGGAHGRRRQQRVDERGLAHARLPDEHRALSREPRQHRRGVALGGELDDRCSRAPRSAPGARAASRNAGRSALFANSTKRHAGGLGGDHPAVHELLSSERSGATTPAICVTLAASSFSLNASER